MTCLSLLKCGMDLTILTKRCCLTLGKISFPTKEKLKIAIKVESDEVWWVLEDQGFFQQGQKHAI